MSKVPDFVNLVDFQDDDAPKHDGDKPLSITKAERMARLTQQGVKFYKADQRPTYKKSVHRKKACPICGLSRGKLMAICPRCKNCLACGSYNGEQRDLICKNCGNYDSGKPETVPTIIVN
jgi:hypothetical protein